MLVSREHGPQASMCFQGSSIQTLNGFQILLTQLPVSLTCTHTHCLHRHLGNEVPRASMCFQGPSIQSIVTAAQGWEFVNEGTERKPKTGYVAKTPGG